MGITLLKLFEKWAPADIAQLYVHTELPSDSTVCTNYYRITDTDAIKMVFPFVKAGKRFGESDIRTDLVRVRTDTGALGAVYQKGRSRTPLIYMGRDLVWKLSHWFTSDLKKWVDDFAPDIIFLASGDYTLIYRIAMKIADYKKIPIVTCCFDDFYLFNANGGSLLGRLRQKQFMKTALKTVERSSFLLCISEKMADDYSLKFGKTCHYLYTPADACDISFDPDRKRLAYFGGIGGNRYEQLVLLGKAILDCRSENKPEYIEVYSSETRPEVLSFICPENGLRFCGFVSHEEIKDKFTQCMGVIHTEMFDEVRMNRVKYSISTKIAESLAYGPCLIAYGPAGVASFDYLESNNAGYVIHQEDDLVKKLDEFFDNTSLREEIERNARILASREHDPDVNFKKLKEWMSEAVRTFEKQSL